MDSFRFDETGFNENYRLYLKAANGKKEGQEKTNKFRVVLERVSQHVGWSDLRCCKTRKSI
jgi:hypothetical protein